MALAEKTEDAMIQSFCGGDADTIINQEIQNARKMILLKSKEIDWENLVNNEKISEYSKKIRDSEKDYNRKSYKCQSVVSTGNSDPFEILNKRDRREKLVGLHIGTEKMNKILHENIMKLRGKINVMQGERAKRFDKINSLSKNLMNQMLHAKKLDSFEDTSISKYVTSLSQVITKKIGAKNVNDVLVKTKERLLVVNSKYPKIIELSEKALRQQKLDVELQRAQRDKAIRVSDNYAMAKIKFINRIKSEGKARQTLITQLQTFAFGSGDLDKTMLLGRLKNNLSPAAKTYLQNCEKQKRENESMMNFIKPVKSKESTQLLMSNQAQLENERRLTEGMKTVLQPFGISVGNKLKVTAFENLILTGDRLTKKVNEKKQMVLKLAETKKKLMSQLEKFNLQGKLRIDREIALVQKKIEQVQNKKIQLLKKFERLQKMKYTVAMTCEENFQHIYHSLQNIEMMKDFLSEIKNEEIKESTESNKYALYVFKRFEYFVFGLYQKTVKVVLDFQNPFEKEEDKYIDTIYEKSSTDENEDVHLDNDKISSRSSKTNDDDHRIINSGNLVCRFLKEVEQFGFENLFVQSNNIRIAFDFHKISKEVVSLTEDEDALDMNVVTDTRKLIKKYDAYIRRIKQLPTAS